MLQPVIKGNELFAGPSFAFLIEHSDEASGKSRKVLYDLGVRLDFMNLAQPVVDNFGRFGMKVAVEKGIVDILESGGIKAQEIEGVIWR